MTIDIKTLYLISAVVTLSGAAAVLLTWYHHRSAPALRAWACALILANVGTFVLRVRGPFSSVNATMAADTLIISGFALIWANQFLANRGKLNLMRETGLTLGIAIVFVALFSVIFSAGGGQGMRSTYVAFSLFAFVLCMATAVEFWRGIARDGLQSRIVVAWAFVGLAACRAIRGVIVSLEATNVIEPELSNAMTSYALYATVILALAVTYGLVLMANERALRRDEELFGH